MRDEARCKKEGARDGKEKRFGSVWIFKGQSLAE